MSRSCPDSPPLVSVIVPAYNAERWLERCLNSVVGQDYPAVELIVVDDGSTDATAAIIDDFATRYDFVEAVHRPNGGSTEARRTGFGRASGAWIQWLDADDELLPGAIGDLVRKGEAEEADIVAVPFVFCSEDGRREASAHVRFDRLSGTEYLGEILRQRAYWALWSNFHRRELLTDDIRFFPGIAIGEDCLTMIQLLMKDPTVVALDRPALNYRIHAGSVTHGGLAGRKQYRDLLFVYGFMREALARRGLEAHFGEELAEQECQLLYSGLCWGGIREVVRCGCRLQAFLGEHPRLAFRFSGRQLRFARACSRCLWLGYAKALFNRTAGRSW